MSVSPPCPKREQGCHWFMSIPDLKGSRAEYSRLLVFGHVWSSFPLIPRYHLLFLSSDRVLILFLLFFCSPRCMLIARSYDVLCVACIFVCAATDILLKILGLIKVGLLWFIESWLAVRSVLLAFQPMWNSLRKVFAKTYSKSSRPPPPYSSSDMIAVC